MCFLRASSTNGASCRTRVSNPELNRLTPVLLMHDSILQAGIRVDEFLQTACSDILCLFILSVNTELALGPLSQVRVSLTSAVQSTGNAFMRSLVSKGLVWLSNAWDPVTRVAALSSLLKVYVLAHRGLRRARSLVVFKACSKRTSWLRFAVFGLQFLVCGVRFACCSVVVAVGDCNA